MPSSTMHKISPLDYITNAALQVEIAERIMEKLEVIRLEPSVIVDLGCGPVSADTPLSKTYPDATIIHLDDAFEMLSQSQAPCALQAFAETLPLADNSVDLVYSNMLLHHCADLTTVFEQCRRVLKPEGLMMFSCLGPDSFQQLRQSFSHLLNAEVQSPYQDMHDVGDAMMQAKFVDPVMDMETITVEYGDFTKLQREVSTFATMELHASVSDDVDLVDKVWQHYQQQYSQSDSYPITLEVVYGHAWGPSLTVDQVADESGVVRIPVSHILSK